PDITYTAYKLSDGVTVLSVCQFSGNPPTPGCNTTLNEPVKLTMLATPGTGDTSASLNNPSVTNSIPLSGGTASIQNFEIVVSNPGLTETFTSNVSASAAASPSTASSGPLVQPYTINLSSLYAGLFAGTAQANSASVINYTWALPTYVPGPGF